MGVGVAGAETLAPPRRSQSIIAAVAFIIGAVVVGSGWAAISREADGRAEELQRRVESDVGEIGSVEIYAALKRYADLPTASRSTSWPAPAGELVDIVGVEPEVFQRPEQFLLFFASGYLYENRCVVAHIDRERPVRTAIWAGQCPNETGDLVVRPG